MQNEFILNSFFEDSKFTCITYKFYLLSKITKMHLGKK